MRLLTVNVGSTSVKLALVERSRLLDRPPSLDEVLADRPEGLEAVVHRIVHGGHRSAPVVVDDAVEDELNGLVERAPLHQRPALEVVRRFREAWPDLPQVACFDTTFHRTIPPGAATYALPERLRSTVRVFGFHGLSHAWSTRQVRAHAREARRVVVAHLGGGQSLCGVLDGCSVTTTMGFTPLDGLVMATRSGTLDPGAVLWMARHTGEDLAHVLEHESGLQGLCGSSDMRTVLDRRSSGDEEAALALEVYLHRLLYELGGCVAALGGLDALVFTGGVGEHSTALRSLVADRLDWLGVELDDRRPAGGDDDAFEITAPGSRVRTFVVTAREDLQMADEATRLLSDTG